MYIFNCIYRKLPFACKGEMTAVVWYLPFYWHTMKINIFPSLAYGVISSTTLLSSGGFYGLHTKCSVETRLGNF